MGVVFNSVERLGSPFEVVDERSLVLPREGSLDFGNRRGKVIILLSGECYQSLDGGRPVYFREGDVVVVPGNCHQRYYAPKEGKSQSLHVLRLVCQASFSALGGGREPELSFNAFMEHHFRQPVILAQAVDGETASILHELRKEVEGKLPGFRHRIHCFCRSLIILLARKQHLPEQRSADSSRPARLDTVNQAKEYILKNLTSELHLGEIAWHAGVSEEHLSRIFRQITGQTVFNYIREMRLETAKTLLCGTRLSVTEIASRCGFSSTALFSRNFKTYVGINARKYRILHGSHFEDVRGRG